MIDLLNIYTVYCLVQGDVVMNIDNALVMLYKKELFTKDDEKEIFRLVPFMITKGYIKDNVFNTYEEDNDNIISCNYIEYLENGNVLEELSYGFYLDLDALSEKLKQNFEEDYEEFKKFFENQEFYLAKRLSDNLTKTLTKYDNSDVPEEVCMKSFNDFLDVYDKVQEINERRRLMTTDELYNIVSSSIKCQDSQIKEIITNIVKKQ